MDFGVARHVGDASEQLDDASRFVTTAYASPEQAQRSPTDSRSDLYSVGCVLYELLTGRPPFVGEEQDVLFERLVDEPKAPSAHNPEVSPDLVVCSMFVAGGMVAAEAAGLPFDVVFPNTYLLPARGIPP